MDYPVPMIITWEVIERCLYCSRCLIECLIPNGMHLYLESCAVGCFTKLSYLLVGIIKDSISTNFVNIRFYHCGIMGAKASIERAFKASSYPWDLSTGRRLYVKRLREHSDLKSVFHAFCKPLLKTHVCIHWETNS